MVALYAADPCLVVATPNALKLDIEAIIPKHSPNITSFLSIFSNALPESSIGSPLIVAY